VARIRASGHPRLLTFPGRHLFLVRHGESAWNAEARLQGQADPPLSEAGRAQARALASWLAATVPRDAGAVVSDLQRARDTAELAGHPAAEVDADWRERGVGEWTGMLEAELPPGELRAFRDRDHVPPTGEAWPAFQARVGAAIDALDTRGGDWVVFTHGGCVRAAVAHLTGADPKTIAGPANASLTRFEIAPRRRLLAFSVSAPGGQE
jgi:broad specificity phosphatase PhoE